MAAPNIFNRGRSSGLSPSFGHLYQGSVGGISPAAVQSGRSWLDPNRAFEREQRLRDRMLRQQAAGGGGGGGRADPADPAAPLPEGAFQKNATTGQEVTLLPPTMTSKTGGAYDRKRLERLGARFEPLVGLYDPRTGLSQTLTPIQAMQRGLLGSAQRALLEGLNSGRPFSRTNPFV